MNTVRQTLRPAAILFLLTFVLLIPLSASSQSELEKALKQYSADAVQGYIQPVADLFGANMQAGFYHSAAIPQGFHFGLDIVGMGSLVSDGQKTYEVKLPPGFTLAPGASKSSARKLRTGYSDTNCSNSCMPVEHATRSTARSGIWKPA